MEEKVDFLWTNRPWVCQLWRSGHRLAMDGSHSSHSLVLQPVAITWVASHVRGSALFPAWKTRACHVLGRSAVKEGVQPSQHGSHGILWACSGNPWKSSMTLYNLGRFSLERRCLLLGLAGIRKSSHGRVVQGTHGRGSTDSMTWNT